MINGKLLLIIRELSTFPPLQPIGASSVRQVTETVLQPIGAAIRPTMKPISASIRSNVGNVNDIKKLCCRKGCLKCVDTPSYRERTVGSASRRR